MSSPGEIVGVIRLSSEINAEICDEIGGDSFLHFAKGDFKMASTEPVRVPERRPETAENAAPRPLPSPRKTRYTIKMKGMVPT